MNKYRCTICGYIYDEDKESEKFSDLKDTFVCPLCGSSKQSFKIKVTHNIIDDTPSNAIKIDKNNICIKRDISKCINCGICKHVCINREGMDFGDDTSLCLNCGQCLIVCPTNSITSRSPIDKILKAKKEGKVLIAYTSPAVRVGLAEAFNMKPGTILQEKLVGLLRMLGFDYVFDTASGADVTVMEEAYELLERINNNGKLPMFTSCCPAWVKYAEINYPELLDNISTCKSPIAMEGTLIKHYFDKVDEKKMYTVAITPCTAKKYEIKRDEICDTDAVLTISEVIDIVKDKKIKYEDIKDSKFDDFLSEGSGSGIIFGNTGGVMEAAIRTCYYLANGKSLKRKDLAFKPVRGLSNIKEASVKLNGKRINVCVIHKMASAIPILDDVKNGKSKYHYIEIMNCLGGCIGGGGLPKYSEGKEIRVKEKRARSLYNKDKSLKNRFAYDNPCVNKLYDKYLGKPCSEKAYELLHTNYVNRSDYKKNTK